MLASNILPPRSNLLHVRKDPRQPAMLVAQANALVVGVPFRAVSAASVTMRMPWEPVEADKSKRDLELEEGKDGVKKGIDFSGLAQVMAMGAGAPMLGDLKKMNFDKSEAEGGAALQFELEANNFEDENGNIKSGEYRDSGWVDEDAPDVMSALGNMFKNPFGKKWAWLQGPFLLRARLIV